MEKNIIDQICEELDEGIKNKARIDCFVGLDKTRSEIKALDEKETFSYEGLEELRGIDNKREEGNKRLTNLKINSHLQEVCVGCKLGALSSCGKDLDI
ncbi:MAG: hypothetical protein LBM01_01685 [Christensenellaceae bacterium]|jgi:predicted nuclease with TOPRIM domain|nr:hypothetical protein [Christensenellaceae bacterium]